MSEEQDALSETQLVHAFIRRGASLSLLRRYFHLTQKTARPIRERLGIHRPAGREFLPAVEAQRQIVALWQDSRQGPAGERERLLWLHEQCKQAYSLSVLYTVLQGEFGPWVGVASRAAKGKKINAR